VGVKTFDTHPPRATKENRIMETTAIKEKFIELRAQGWSFDKIANELGKAKQTLIDWSRELQDEIANRRALELDALYEKYYLYKENRIQVYGELLKRIKDEIEGRDLTDVPTDKLLDLFIKYADKVKEEVIEPKFKTAKEIDEERAEAEILDGLTETPQPSYTKLKTA